MVDFQALARQYVAEESEQVRDQLALSASSAISEAHAGTTAVGNWASSIQQWITVADDGVVDVDSRTKALRFLAHTLEHLNPRLLRDFQVQFLCTFFGSMFSVDPRAGIAPSTRALWSLCRMRNYSPAMGAQIVSQVLLLGDDFSKQPTPARWEVYELLLRLFEDDRVLGELEHVFGPSAGCIVDLIRLCQREREPSSLLSYLTILRRLISAYAASPDVDEELFRAFSNYFPISLNNKISSTAVTTTELKVALRACFSAHQRLASLAFPFLLGKLDISEPASREVDNVSTKVDILQTIQACVEQYRNPQSSLGPYVDRLWSSIKFEVRHGDVKERIDASLGVLRSVANKLAEDLLGENSDTALVRFLDMVSKDCSDDLSNPLYAKQAGLLFVTIATANLQTFTRQGPGLLSALRKAYGTAQSVAQKTDALSLLQLFLRGRQSLLKKDEPRDVAARVLALSEVAFRLEDIWTEDLAPLLSDAPWDTSSDVLGQVLRTAALLASQQSLTETGAAVQSCSRSTYDAMIKVLGSHLFTNRENGHSGTRNSTPDHLSVDNEALLCAIAVVNHYRSGFKQMADMAFEPVHACLRREPRSAFSRLQCSLARLEFIGCAELPSDTSVRDLGGVCDEGPYSSAQHLLCVYRCLLQPLRESFLLSGSSQAHGLQAVLLSGIYRATLVFQDALSHRCTVEATGSTANTEDSGDGEDWTQDFACLSLSVVPPVGSVALPLICEDDLLGARRLSLKAGLYVVWTLYRDILLDPRTDACEDVLSLLSGLAALVIKSMSAARQQVLRLADQMFDLFIRGEETVESRAKPVFREYLVLGIAHGLHPAVMEGLYAPDGKALSFICDAQVFETIPQGVAAARAAVGCVFANKYRASAADSRGMVKIYEFWRTFLEISSQPSQLHERGLEGATQMALHIVAGSLARQDHDVLQLIPVIHEAIAREGMTGSILARSMDTLFMESTYLSRNYHAQVSKLSKSRSYSLLVRPLYARALPAAQGPAAVRNTAIVLSVIPYCPYAIWQDDAIPLSRLLITVLDKPSSMSQVLPALTAVQAIVAHEPGVLQSHLQSVVNEIIYIYGAAQPKEPPSGASAAPRPDGHLARCRKKVLELLAAMPAVYGKELTALSPGVKRLLATASADPVRELRKWALRAKESWAKLD